jgi:hypothetical protein
MATTRVIIVIIVIVIPPSPESSSASSSSSSSGTKKSSKSDSLSNFAVSRYARPSPNLINLLTSLAGTRFPEALLPPP